MKLRINERLQLMTLLPENGSFDKLIIRKDILEKMSIKQEDIEKYSIETKEDRVFWKQVDGTDSEDFTFTELETKYLKDLFTKMNNEEKLTVELLDIYKQLFNL